MAEEEIKPKCFQTNLDIKHPPPQNPLVEQDQEPACACLTPAWPCSAPAPAIRAGTLMGTSPCRDMAGGMQTSSPLCPVPSSAWRCMVGIDLSFQHSVSTSPLLFGGCSCIPVGVSITPQDLSGVPLWCVSWHHRTSALRQLCPWEPDVSALWHALPASLQPSPWTSHHFTLLKTHCGVFSATCPLLFLLCAHCPCQALWHDEERVAPRGRTGLVQPH